MFEDNNKEVTTKAQKPANTDNIYNESYDDLLKYMSEPKETFETKTEFVETKPEPEADSEAEKQKKEDIAKNKAHILKINSSASKIITETVDGVFAWILSSVAYDVQNIDKYRADKEAKADIQKVYELMLPADYNMLPPWAQLVLLYPAVYGPLIAKSFDIRKANKKIKEQDETIKRLEFEAKVSKIKPKEDKQEIVNDVIEKMNNLSPEQLEKFMPKEWKTSKEPTQDTK